MVTVVESNGQSVDEIINQNKSFWDKIDWQLIFNWFLIIVFIAIIILLIVWVFVWIYKKFKDSRKREEDLEYRKYTTDLKMCTINGDSRYAYRVWYKLWLGKRRCPIYAITQLGRKKIGHYMGEAVKKEGFFIMGIRQKYGFFTWEDDVVIFPYQLHKQLVKRNDDFSIDLYCEGIDEVMSSDYYSIPVFANYNKEDERIFTDFSNMVSKRFFQEYVYRDVIKSNIIEFKESVKEATEQNPHIQIGRKTNSALDDNKGGK